jgi:hypothetical protein
LDLASLLSQVIFFVISVFGAVDARAQIRMSGTYAYSAQGNVVTFGVERIESFRPFFNTSGTLAIQLWATSAPYSGAGVLTGFKGAEVSIGTLQGGFYFSNVVRTATVTSIPAGVYNIVFVLAEWNGFEYVTVDSGNFPSRQTIGIVAPSILSSPQSLSLAAGQSGLLSVSALGSAPLTYQWRKNGVLIANVTGSVLSLANAQISDTGSYSVTVSNAAGSVTSATASVAVTALSVAPSIALQPTAANTVIGGSVTFTVSVNGTAPFNYQWRKNSSPIAGATNATLALGNAQLSDAASYMVTITNAAGSVTSSAAVLTVSSPNSGRLINLSVLTNIDVAGDDFTLGYVVGGSGTSGPKPLVIRAAGPSLGALGVPATLDDPKLELFAGSTKTGENDNWGGSSQLSAALAGVGAFAYTGPTSRDAATTASITTRDNSVKVSAVGSGTGKVIAEVYDATPTSLFTMTTPRLINVSVRKHLGSGLTMGFVLGGSTPTKVLVRAIGPTLGSFGVPGTVADPQLTLFNSSSAKIGENNDWGGTAELTAAFTSVGAFALPATAKDAALLVTLSPGNYSVEVSGVSTTTGVALVEVYEVP